jgi:plastocyanin/mono/diheme cytochrome c family protein
MLVARRSFLLGAVTAVLLGVIAAALVIVSGVIDVGAVSSPGIQDRILAYASTRAIARHATREKNPLANDPAALKSGLQHYRAMCVLCHGAPGVDGEEFAAGLHPAAPDLASPPIRSFTDGMLYETISRGIGSTGMPAFGPTHRPEEIWSIVAFVRHLPALTADEREELRRPSPGETAGAAALPSQGPPSHAHDSGGGAHAAAGAPDQRVHHVTISSFKFDPPTVEVHVGDIIEWKNEDFAAHSATAKDRSFDTGRIEPDKVARVVAKKAGRFPYFCRHHLPMKGTLIVQ